MHTPTRRTFLVATSAVTGGAILGVRPRTLRALCRTDTAETLLPQITDTDVFVELAQHTVDVAIQSGAQYADVRIGETQELGVGQGGLRPDIRLSYERGYGVRVLVGGTWGFSHGLTTSREAMAHAARAAVARAKGYASVLPSSATLAPATVVTDTWAGPCEIDPFQVPVYDQLDLMNSYCLASGRVLGALSPQMSMRWSRRAEVFASSEGTCLTQQVTASRPYFRIVGYQYPEFPYQLGGFEVFLRPGVEERIVAFTEDRIKYRHLPLDEIDVGRYPVVFSGNAMAALCGAALIPALELDRVLGYEFNGSGTSYLSPPSDFLGKKVAASEVTVTSDRMAGGANATKWDAEGVAATPVTLIENGVLQDYLTTRATASQLADWYTQQGKPVRSNACAESTAPNRVQQLSGSHVTVVANPDGPTLDELIRSLSRGLLVMHAPVSVDHGLSSALIGRAQAQGIYIVNNGTVTHRLENLGLNARVQQLWGAIEAVGDPSTREVLTSTAYKGEPPHSLERTVAAPAIFVPSMDVVRLSARLQPTP